MWLWSRVNCVGCGEFRGFSLRMPTILAASTSGCSSVSSSTSSLESSSSPSSLPSSSSSPLPLSIASAFPALLPTLDPNSECFVRLEGCVGNDGAAERPRLMAFRARSFSLSISLSSLMSESSQGLHYKLLTTTDIKMVKHTAEVNKAFKLPT